MTVNNTGLIMLFMGFCENIKNVHIAYLAQQEYDEQKKNYSDADGQDNCPQGHSGRLLYTNVWECTSRCLQVTTAPDLVGIKLF